MEPEEWLKKYLDEKPPHGQSPIYSNGQYIWTDIQLLNYDQASGKFYVKVLENGLLKFVNRLSLKFKDEDAANFEKRVELSKQRQRYAEEQTRLLKYINKIPDSLVSEVPAKIVAGLKGRKSDRKDQEGRTYEKNVVFPSLLEDFKKMHIDFEKRFLLHYPEEAKAMLLPQPLPTVVDLSKRQVLTYERYK